MSCMGYCVRSIRKKPACPKPLKELGKHPNDNENISLYKGRYGLYIKYKGVNFGVPKSANSEDISIKYALDIIKKKKKANP